MPPKLKKKISERLGQLIDEGHAVVATIKDLPQVTARNEWLDTMYVHPGGWQVDTPRYMKWVVSAQTGLTQIVGESSIHWRTINQLGNYQRQSNPKLGIAQEVAIVQAIKNDFDLGLLDDLAGRIESEIASDYMGQADELLGEGRGKFDHVPAAVLTGAVLEKALRTLCIKTNPPIPTSTPDGKPLSMDPLIVALKKAGVFQQTTASQLQAWAQIRNKAAHGEFDQFTRQQVEAMIVGVKQFISDHVN
jgi:hypothetical protein